MRTREINGLACQVPMESFCMKQDRVELIYPFKKRFGVGVYILQDVAGGGIFSNDSGKSRFVLLFHYGR
jgi:hypothetical protein